MTLSPVNIVRCIEERMQAEHPAVWEGGRWITYGELFEQVDRLVERLRDWPPMRTGPVPRIGVHGENGLAYVIAALAVLKAGACFVPVAGELAVPEREALMSITALHGLLIVGPNQWLAEQREELAPGLGAVRLPSRPASFPEAAFADLQPAFVRFSSGTTGRSKGVVLSHRSLLDRIVSANQALAVGPDDRVLWVLPMAHHFAVSIILYLYFGAATVLEPARIGADILTTAEATGATVLYGAPFHHAMLAATGDSFRWPTLRLAVSTAAALTTDTASRFAARFGLPLTQGLGIIECGLPILNTRAAAAKPEAIGRPVPGWEIELRAPNGDPVPAGEIGELHLRGPGMFDAYLDPWQTRDQVTRDSWFATGDLALRDADGDLFIKGRSKSVINVGGMKVFPEEVEAVLNTLPGIARSRVRGKPHPVFGAVPVADVILAADAQADPVAWRAACRTTLSPHKVPVSITPVASIELTPSGKIRR